MPTPVGLSFSELLTLGYWKEHQMRATRRDWTIAAALIGAAATIIGALISRDWRPAPSRRDSTTLESSSGAPSRIEQVSGWTYELAASGVVYDSLLHLVYHEGPSDKYMKSVDEWPETQKEIASQVSVMNRLLDSLRIPIEVSVPGSIADSKMHARRSFDLRRNRIYDAVKLKCGEPVARVYRLGTYGRTYAGFEPAVRITVAGVEFEQAAREAGIPDSIVGQLGTSPLDGLRALKAWLVRRTTSTGSAEC